MISLRRHAVAAVILGLGAVTMACAAEPPASSGDDDATAPPSALDQAWADGELRVGIVGDSITVGWMADSEGATYREQVRSASYPGDLTLEWVAEVGYESAEIQPLAAEVISGAEVVVVATGTNDGKSGPAGLEGQYAELLAQVADDQVLLCLGPWGRGEGVSAAAREDCEAAGGRFLSTDGLERLVGPGGGSGWPVPRDEFHPNQDGHDALAALVIEALGGDAA